MRLPVLLTTAGLFACTLLAHADATGTPVTGSLLINGNVNNYFDPTFGYVPPGDGNASGVTVLIGSGVEFGYQDLDNLDTADFTGSTLTVTDSTVSGANAWEMTFSDPSFTGFTELTAGSGYSFAFSGDTLSVFFAGTRTAPSNNTATFAFTDDATAAVTPEPSSLILLGTGLLGGVAMLRRRSTTHSSLT